MGLAQDIWPGSTVAEGGGPPGWSDSAAPFLSQTSPRWCQPLSALKILDGHVTFWHWKLIIEKPWVQIGWFGDVLVPANCPTVISKSLWAPGASAFSFKILASKTRLKWTSKLLGPVLLETHGWSAWVIWWVFSPQNSTYDEHIAQEAASSAAATLMLKSSTWNVQTVAISAVKVARSGANCSACSVILAWNSKSFRRRRRGELNVFVC